eukprot:g11813.t1
MCAARSNRPNAAPRRPARGEAVFNPRWRSASNVTSVFWEKDPSIPGYRALVERPNAVRVQGYDPKGQAVDYVAKGWEARLIQQAFSGCFAGLAHGSPRLEGGWTSFCDRGNL